MVSTHFHQLYFSSAFLISSFFISLSLSDPRITESGLYCSNSKATPSTSQALVPNFVNEMEKLSHRITTNHFATYHLNSSTMPLYALAQCHQDLSQTDCLLCYAASRTRLPRCLPSLSARIYLDGCFLRYDNYSFYDESFSSLDTVKCSKENVSGYGDGGDERLRFVRNVGYAVGNVTSRAVENGRFGVVGVNGVYALAQCWQSVGGEGCKECLMKAGKAVRGCGTKREGRGMNAGCYLRYSTTKFYNDGGDKGEDHGKFRPCRMRCDSSGLVSCLVAENIQDWNRMGKGNVESLIFVSCFC